MTLLIVGVTQQKFFAVGGRFFFQFMQRNVTLLSNCTILKP